MIRKFSRPFVARTLSAACLAAAVFSAAPAAAWTDWHGGGFVTDFSPQCASEGFTGMRQITARYRPSGLPQNGNRTRLTMLFELGAMNFSTDGRFARRFRPVDTIAIFSSPWPMTNPQPRLRLLPGSTFNITQSTRNVSLTGAVRNFAAVQGCTARFRVFMSRHN